MQEYIYTMEKKFSLRLRMAHCTNAITHSVTNIVVKTNPPGLMNHFFFSRGVLFYANDMNGMMLQYFVLNKSHY